MANSEALSADYSILSSQAFNQANTSDPRLSYADLHHQMHYFELSGLAYITRQFQE